MENCHVKQKKPHNETILDSDSKKVSSKDYWLNKVPTSSYYYRLEYIAAKINLEKKNKFAPSYTCVQT